MSPAKFVADLQGYYGVKYTEVEQPVVGAWIKTEHALFGDAHMGLVFNQVTADVSKNFGRLPDKALLEAAAKKVRPERDPNRLPVFAALPEPEAIDEQALYEEELKYRSWAASKGRPITDEALASFAPLTIGELGRIATAKPSALRPDAEMVLGDGQVPKVRQNEGMEAHDATH